MKKGTPCFVTYLEYYKCGIWYNGLKKNPEKSGRVLLYIVISFDLWSHINFSDSVEFVFSN